MALDDKGEDIIGKQIIIKSNEIKGASFIIVSNENDQYFLEDKGQSFYGNDEEGYTTKCYFNVLDSNAEKVTLN